MANTSYSLDPNRETPYKVVDYTDEIGREGIYSGSYEDCQMFMAEQAEVCSCIGMDIVPNPYYRKKQNKTMANFVLEVIFEEGRTDCDNCPFRTDNGCCDIPTEHKLDCDKYDLTTIKLRKNIGEIKLNFRLMEIKLNKANENIIELVERLVNAKVANHSGHCLKIILFGEDRSNCEDCNACCREQIRRYREMLLEQYLVK